MKAWVVRDYKEIHMANCLIAIAHKKPEGDLQCVEVNILTDTELQELIEKAVDDRVAPWEYEVNRVYCELTNNKFSKISTDAGYILEEVEVEIDRRVEDETKELTQRIKALKAEREQIAREAWEDGEGSVDRYGNGSHTFNDYWQQKQKEQDDKR